MAGDGKTKAELAATCARGDGGIMLEDEGKKAECGVEDGGGAAVDDDEKKRNWMHEVMGVLR